MKTYREWMSLALFGGEGSVSGPGPRKESPVPTGWEAGWIPEPVWAQNILYIETCFLQMLRQLCPI
jgi:hypothetical protein